MILKYVKTTNGDLYRYMKEGEILVLKKTGIVVYDEYLTAEELIKELGEEQ